MSLFEKSKKSSSEKASVLRNPDWSDPNYRFINLRGLEFKSPQTDADTTVDESEREIQANEDGLASLRSDSKSVDIFEASSNEFLTFENLESSSEVPDDLLEIPEVFQNDLFAQAINSRWTSGIFIRLEAGSESPVVLRTRHHAVKGSEALYSRVIIIAEEGVELSYTDEFFGEAQNAFVGSLVEIYAHPRSKVSYFQSQRLSTTSKYFSRQYFNAGEETQINYVPALSGGERSQIRTEAFCLDEGSSINTFGAVRGDGLQQFDFWMNSHHNVAKTTSQTELWSVLGQKARAQFNGNLKIGVEGRLTDASQTSHNLMISDQAEMVSQPNLEIATDDVKCAHGAYIQSIDDDQLFYLQARGIPEKEGRRMIVNGFTEPVLERFETISVQESIRKEFLGKKED